MTIDLQALKQENQRWHQQYASWVSETQKWQKETHRLAALLYLLDKALPEHSELLNKHIALIEKYEAMVTCYDCGLEPRCFESCDSYKTLDEQMAFHQELCQFHEQVELEHDNLRQTFMTEMEKFKKLAKELVEQVVID